MQDTDWCRYRPDDSARPAAPYAERMCPPLSGIDRGLEGLWLPRPIDLIEYWESEHSLGEFLELAK